MKTRGVILSPFILFLSLNALPLSPPAPPPVSLDPAFPQADKLNLQYPFFQKWVSAISLIPPERHCRTCITRDDDAGGVTGLMLTQQIFEADFTYSIWMGGGGVRDKRRQRKGIRKEKDK